MHKDTMYLQDQCRKTLVPLSSILPTEMAKECKTHLNEYFLSAAKRARNMRECRGILQCQWRVVCTDCSYLYQHTCGTLRIRDSITNSRNWNWKSRKFTTNVKKFRCAVKRAAKLAATNSYDRLSANFVPNRCLYVLNILATLWKPAPQLTEWLHHVYDQETSGPACENIVGETSQRKRGTASFPPPEIPALLRASPISNTRLADCMCELSRLCGLLFVAETPARTRDCEDVLQDWRIRQCPALCVRLPVQQRSGATGPSPTRGLLLQTEAAGEGTARLPKVLSTGQQAA